MRNVPLKLLATLLVLVAAAGPAAADPKNYSGNTCQPITSTATGLSRATTSWGRAHNTTNASMIFVCPAVKDSASVASAVFYVLDQRTDAAVSCTLYSGRPTGSALNCATSATTAAFSSPTPTPITYGALPSTALGHYWATCVVPGTSPAGQPSGVMMYQITEA